MTGCSSSSDTTTSAPSADDSVAADTETPADSNTESAADTDTEAADTNTDTSSASNTGAVDPLNWSEYNDLIKEIKSTTDFTEREAMMHRAEDILMETGAILPLYYYNDIYMQKSNVSNIYANLYGFKYFQFAQADTDTLRLNLGSEPDHLDPALNTTVDGACLAVASFAGLYTYDAEGNLQPDLVSDYTVSEDGMTYTFNLLPDLKWSDGSELNANDFVYSWNRAVAESTAADYAYMFDVIATNSDGTLQIEASEDGQSLTVQLGSPCAYFLDLCAFPAYYPVKQSAVEAVSDWETNPGGWCQEAGFVTMVHIHLSLGHMMNQ